MTDLRKLHEAATPGPWRQTGTVDKPHWYVTSDTAQVHGNLPSRREDYEQATVNRWVADAALIAATRNALPFLLDVVEAVERWEPQCPTAVRYAFAVLAVHLNSQSSQK